MKVQIEYVNGVKQVKKLITKEFYLDEIKPLIEDIAIIEDCGCYNKKQKSMLKNKIKSAKSKLTDDLPYITDDSPLWLNRKQGAYKLNFVDKYIAYKLIIVKE